MTTIRNLAFGLLAAMAVAVALAPSRAADAPPPAGAIDWNRAQTLYQRERRGEKLTPDEQAYLDRAKAARQQGQGPGRPPGPPTSAPAARESTGLKPLTEMAAADKYKGEDGGLYGGGSNEPPKPLADAAARDLAKIVPLDAEGRPAKDGKIVLVSVGMSNTTQEFSRFKQLADADPDKSPRVVIVDGAQGGKAGKQWAAPDAPPWAAFDKRLTAAGVSAKQVQAAWIKQAEIQPARLGEFPAHARELQKNLATALNVLKDRCPNVRVAYLSSRIYAGYATTPLNPEPFAYEGAFSVRWLIQDQGKGSKDLNWDPARGEVKSPLLLWGPYLWGDGLTPRKADGLVWKRSDLGPDGTHPSPESGRQKVAELLLKFFKTDPQAKGWFKEKGSEAILNGF